MTVKLDELDKIPDEEFATGNFSRAEESKRVVDKANLIKGFNYGKDIVPVSELDAEDFAPKKEAKQLKLIQFCARGAVRNRRRSYQCLV